MSDTFLPATAVHAALVVTTSSQTALAAPSAWRRGALLVNDSDEVMYLNLGGTAVANTGIRLNANGGSLLIGEDQSMNFQGAVTAIHGGTGNKTLLITSW